MSRQTLDALTKDNPEKKEPAGSQSSLEQQDRLLAFIIETIRTPKCVISQVAELTDNINRFLMRPDGTIVRFAWELLLSGSFGMGVAVRRPNAKAPYEVDLTLLIEGSNRHRHLTYEAVCSKIARELDIFRLTKGETRLLQVSQRGIQMRLRQDSVDFLVNVEPFFASGYGGVQLPAMLRLYHGEARRLPDQGYRPSLSAMGDGCPALEGCDRDLFDPNNPKMFIGWFKERIRRSQGTVDSPTESDESDPLIQAGGPLVNALRLLLYFRNIFFSGWSEHSPLSMSIIRLASEVYRGQTSLAVTIMDVLKAMNRLIAPTEPGVILSLNPAAEGSSDRNRTKALFFHHNQYLSEFLNQAEQDFQEMLSSDPENAMKKAERLFCIDLSDFS